MIYELPANERKKIEPLFLGWEETLIWSCLEGYMGNAFADDKENPASAIVLIADFCFLAGSPSEELAEFVPKAWDMSFIILIPENLAWERMIEKVYGNQAKKITRYAIKKEKDIFRKDYLQSFLSNVPEEVEVKMIDNEIYQETKRQKWANDLCSQFADYEDYRERGIGTAALYNGELVAGASSYTIYSGGIEIEIDTREDYRRKGLAAACGAKLILECQKRSLYPGWDAQNKNSLALAEKLGYHFDHEYTAYEVVIS